MFRAVKTLGWVALLLVAGVIKAEGLRMAGPSRDGTLSVTNTFTNGVLTVGQASALGAPAAPVKQAFSTGTVTRVQVTMAGSSGFFRAAAAGLSGISSWSFIPADIVDLTNFAAALDLALDGVSEFIASNLSPPTQELLYAYGGGADPALQAALAADLSVIITNGPIYDPGVFAGVELRPLTQSMLSQAPVGLDLVHLNRLLIEDAYPTELARKRDSGFTNLVHAYGLLTTVAGAGGTPASPNNKWLAEFEGGPATNALLSRPHIAMADRAGNIYIADKEAHAIRKVTLDGMIHTVAGNNVPGFGDTNAVAATSVSLRNPNGLWVKEDGTFYILDRDNGLIRRVDTNGIMTALVNHGAAIPGGRGLWVSPDESILFYSAGTRVMRWNTTNGLTEFLDGFVELGNLAVSPSGRLAVTDRGTSMAYYLDGDGTKTPLAGSGYGRLGGEGWTATNTYLLQLRGIFFLPTGACFLATDDGSQVWHVDAAGYAHLFLNGDWSSHAGDGSWFYDPSVPKVSKVRQITVDFDGDLIITENDAGYIRKVRFLPSGP
jgi:sugar lactone lactonase YvrE